MRRKLIAISIISLVAGLGTIVPTSTSVVHAVAAAAWTSAGPYGDDATAVAVSPNFDTDHTVFMASAFNSNVGNLVGHPMENATAAIMRSTDGGATWATVWRYDTPADASHLKARVMQLAISPAFATDGTIFALWNENTDGGVLRSTNGGQSFQDVTGSLPATSFTNVSEGASLALSPQYGTDTTIAVSPNGGTSTTSYLSTNGGTTWQPVTVSGKANGCDVSGGGYLVPLGGGKLGSYLAAGNGVCGWTLNTLYASSADGGTTWTAGGDIQAAANANFDSQHSHLYALSGGSTLIYTDQYGNVVRSADSGLTWHSLLPGTLDGYTPVGASGRAPFTFDIAPGGRGIFAVPLWGKAAPHLYHSSDAGATWTLQWASNGVTALNDVSAGGAAAIFYAAGNEGLLRSQNNGATWYSVGSWKPQFSSVAASPAFPNDGTVFTTSFPSGMITTQGQDCCGFGIFGSGSGGATWSAPESANPDQSVSFGDVYTTAINGGQSLAVSPAFATDHTVFEGDRIGTVHISHDGGVNWTTSYIGNQVGWYIYGLAVSPRFASDRAVFAALGNLGFGIVRSNDGGQTWMQDVPQDRINEITEAATHDVQVAVDPSGPLDVAVVIGGNVYLEQDDGHSSTPSEWYAIGQGLKGMPVTVAFSPNYARDCTMYAGVGQGGQVLGNTLDDGLYVSHNACFANALAGAVTWTRLTNGMPAQDISSIVLSPNFAVDHTLFAASQTLGIFESTDGGASWNTFNTGLGTMTVRKLTLAPIDGVSSMLFAATDSGVWQTTVPIAPPPLTLNPTAATFGTQLMGTTSTARTIVLTNSGTAPFSISSIGIGGANAGDFAQTNNCPGTSLAVGASCTISVTFAPTTTGTRSANLVVSDSAAGSPHLVPLTGIGGTTVTLTAGAGWNMVGGSPLTLWSDATTTWSFTAATPAWYHPTGTEPAGTGAWESVPSAGPRTVTVQVCSGALSVPVVPHRWNLVGNPCSLRVTLPATARAYIWDTTAGRYVLVSSIGPGAAAWVKPDTSILTLTPTTSTLTRTTISRRGAAHTGTPVHTGTQARDLPPRPTPLSVRPSPPLRGAQHHHPIPLFRHP
ncbi:MAG: hypothetical protein PVSMB7_24350 [Chloroflexota bacterium]